MKCLKPADAKAGKVIDVACLYRIPELPVFMTMFYNLATMKGYSSSHDKMALDIV